MAEREVMRFRADPDLIKFIDDTAKEEDIGNRSKAIRYLLRLAQFTINAPMEHSIVESEAFNNFVTQFNNKW